VHVVQYQRAVRCGRGGHALRRVGVGRKVGHLSGTWSSISLLSSGIVVGVFVLSIVVGARACPRGAKAAKRGKGGATFLRPPIDRAQVIWPTFG